jgi:hypothetical protein
MVLVLPLLMMIMSMIIVFGYMISWKLRTETVSRDAIWRDRIDHFSNRDARQSEWPDPEIIAVDSAPNLEDFDADPVTTDPIIRGPIPAVNVNSDLLDFGRGVRIGIADIDRSPPIFATLASIDFRVEHSLLDNQFRYWQLGHGNFQRRIPHIYSTELDFIRDSASMQAAVAAIDNASFLDQLEALDRDQEFIDWYGSAPDFHPRVGSFCENDFDLVMEDQVVPLIRRIARLPITMARASIRLYEAQLRAQPPLSEAEQQELRRKIAALEAWLSTIDN